MQSENEFLRSLTQRLQSELHRCLKLHGINAETVASKESVDDHEVDVPPWIYEEQTMSPLLIAYDDRIQELEAENERLGISLASTKDRVDRVVRENTDLRMELGTKLQSSIQAAEAGDESYPSAFPEDPTTLGLSTAHRSDELRERTALLSEEAELLREEVSTLGQENQDLRTALQERSDRLEEVSQERDEYYSQTELLARRVAVAQEAQHRLERRVKELTESMTGSGGDVQRLTAELDSARQETAAQLDRVEEYRRALEELGKRAQEEAESLASRARAAFERARELKRQLEQATEEARATRSDLRAAQRELTTVRGDCEDLHKMVRSQQKQLADVEARERRAASVEKEAMEKLEAAVMDRDTAQSREVQARREIARLQERRRLEREEALQGEEETVSTVRQRWQATLRSREEELDEVNHRCVELQGTLERAQRAKQTAEREAQSAREAVRQDLQQLQQAVEDEGSRAAEAERAASAQVRAADEARRRVMAELEQTKEEHRRVEMRVQSLQAELSSAEARRADADSGRTQWKEKATQLERAFQRRQTQAKEERDELQSELEMERERSGRDAAAWRHRVDELQSDLEVAERRASEAIQEATEAKVSARNEVRQTLAHYQSLLSQSREECDRLRHRTEELSAQLASVMAETAAVEDIVEQAELGWRQSQEEAERARAAARKRGRQLAQLLSSEESSAREVAQLRAELETAQHRTGGRCYPNLEEQDDSALERYAVAAREEGSGPVEQQEGDAGGEEEEEEWWEPRDRRGKRASPTGSDRPSDAIRSSSVHSGHSRHPIPRRTFSGEEEHKQEDRGKVGGSGGGGNGTEKRVPWSPSPGATLGRSPVAAVSPMRSRGMDGEWGEEEEDNGAVVAAVEPSGPPPAPALTEGRIGEEHGQEERASPAPSVERGGELSPLGSLDAGGEFNSSTSEFEF